MCIAFGSIEFDGDDVDEWNEIKERSNHHHNNNWKNAKLYGIFSPHLIYVHRA